MPWKVCKPMDERLKFIARLLDGEQMAGLCREFGISRKTGYKIRDLQARTPCKSLRTKGVTYVLGMKRNPCVRNGPVPKWRTRHDSNVRPLPSEGNALSS
jgi:hypothetical protein